MNADETQLLREVSEIIAEIPDADHPYWTSTAVSGLVAGPILETSNLAGELYAVWSALQDWYEMRPGDAAETLDAIRRAATEWPTVADDVAARREYFDRWASVVRDAFTKPERTIAPDVDLGPLQGRVESYDSALGVGFLRADSGGPTYFFRWNAIKTDAFYKTIDVGARVTFRGFVSAAGERSARDVVPASADGGG